jgi:hypothetical protein
MPVRPLVPFVRSLLLAGILVLLAPTVGCGHSKVSMRTAGALACIDQARKTPVVLPGGAAAPARVIGWLSVASIDRWVKEIDRLGQRAGLFAPGSSYREHLRRRAAELVAPLGVQGVAWVDESRPHYLVMQEQGKTTYKGRAVPPKVAWVFGLSALLPTMGAESFDKAVRKDALLAETSGHARALKVTSKTVWIDPINHYTEVATVHTDRFALAAPAAKCLHNRTPVELLHAGVAVGDLYRHYRPQIELLLDKGTSDMPKTDVAKNTGKALRMLTKWAGKHLEQTDVVELTADANAHALKFGVSYRALPGTDAAARLAKLAAAKPNTLLNRLPAGSWWVSGQSHAGDSDASDLDGFFDMYVTMLGLSPDVIERLKKYTSDWTALLGGHTASALYVDGRFPFAYINIQQNKDPEAIVALLSNGFVDFVAIAEQASRKARKFSGRKAKPFDSKVKALLDRLKSKDIGWLIDEVVKESQGGKVKLAYNEIKRDGVRCRVLSAEADMAKLATNRAAMRVIGFTGRKLQLSLCTTAKLLIVLMGPNTVQEAIRMAKGERGGFADNKAFKRLSSQGTPPLTLMMLDPGPIVRMFGKMLPIPIHWPQDEALSMTCRAKSALFGCEFAVPLALIDIGRQVREAFRGFGK